MAGVVTARTAVLQYLLRGESWGREIMRGIANIAGMKVSDNSVYPLLESLVADGLATRRIALAPAGVRGGSFRYYYKLTAAGARQAREVRHQLYRVLSMSTDACKPARRRA